MIVQTDNKKTTAETKRIEAAFAARGFEIVTAYRYNSVSIRVRLVSDKFKGKSTADRESMIYQIIEKLPLSTRQDITFLLLATPDELKNAKSFLNMEFEDPSPSDL